MRDEETLRSGGSIPLEGCTAYGDTENTYKGILNYDVYRGRYTISDPVYDKPYVPKYLRDQLSDADVKTLLAGGQVSADQVKDSFGEPMKNKVLYVNPRDNRTYSRFLSRQERSEAAEASIRPRRGPMSRSRGGVGNDSIPLWRYRAVVPDKTGLLPSRTPSPAPVPRTTSGSSQRRGRRPLPSYL